MNSQPQSTNGPEGGDEVRKFAADYAEVTGVRSSIQATAASRKRSAPKTNLSPPKKKGKSGQQAGSSVFNARPHQRLDVYIFGSGESGKLGLGKHSMKQNGKVLKPPNVTRPPLNPYLASDKVGVVQIVTGGTHPVALNQDGKILTWGVNDGGPLGRDTTWDGGMESMDTESQDDGDESDGNSGDTEDMNPHECLPGEVDFAHSDLPPSTAFTQVAAGDSISVALTSTGRVYAWGHFRANDGVFGFGPEVHMTFRTRLIPELKNITSIVAGPTHVLALDVHGNVFAWGSGQQCQLGRKLVLGRHKDTEERRLRECLIPAKIHLPRGKNNAIQFIASGSYHSFIVTYGGDVLSWGLNNFGETGQMHNAGIDDAVIVTPSVVKALRGQKIVSIQGGSHHTIAATAEGDCYAFGRFDGGQIGLSADQLPALPEDQVMRDEHGKPRIIARGELPGIKGKVIQIATDSDHNIVVTADGKAWSWVLSPCYETGQGELEDVLVPTRIQSVAIRDKMLNGAITGGQFSILTGAAV